MTFIAAKGLDSYFRGVGHAKSDGNQFGLLFDKYYLCLLVGLDERRIGQPADIGSDEIVRGYPQDYSGQKDILAGLLIDAELGRQGITENDRESIQQVMLRLLDHTSPSGLSTEGEQALNRYAAGGLSVLRDRIPPPQSLSDFLSAYVQLWHPPQEL